MSRTRMARSTFGMQSDPDDHWEDAAECARLVRLGLATLADWELVGMKITQGNQRAAAICIHRCPVRAECLADALATEANGVVRAGLRFTSPGNGSEILPPPSPKGECATCGELSVRPGRTYCSTACSNKGKARGATLARMTKETING